MGFDIIIPLPNIHRCHREAKESMTGQITVTRNLCILLITRGFVGVAADASYP
jgi:hypothetical protein